MKSMVDYMVSQGFNREWVESFREIFKDIGKKYEIQNWNDVEVQDIRCSDTVDE